jgi:hypothetical protein
MSNKPREFHCLYNPELGELTYGHRHGCTDGYEEIHVIEYSAYEAVNKFNEQLLQENLGLARRSDDDEARAQKLREALEFIAVQGSDSTDWAENESYKYAKSILDQDKE